MDSLIDIKNFKLLNSKPLLDSNLLKNVRLLSVFGLNGAELMFVTNEDQVYGYGFNRCGRLGLGHWNTHLMAPELNISLSHKGIIDIAFGYEHCLALTSTGQVFAFGNNQFGQLGIGNSVATHTPQLIEGLSDKVVVQIVCGCYHNLSLTSDGQVYSWGHNTMGSLGDRSYWCHELPIQVIIKEQIYSISAGKYHSMALTEEGMLYVWGLNEFGQLGRDPEVDSHCNRLKPISNRPEVLPEFANIYIKKAVCGPNHSLVLSTDGTLYTFGHNDCGQIGSGFFEDQYKPMAINGKLKFKDIVSHYGNDMSIAVSMDDKYFVWGFASNRVMSSMTEIKEPIVSLMDIYSKLAKNKITFKSVVVPEMNGLNETNGSLTPSAVSLDQSLDQMNENNISIEDENRCELNATQSSVLKHFNESFNNPIDSDLKFVFNGKFIYCHKIVLKIRNKKFWDFCENLINSENDSEISVETHSYEKFFAFLQYLYGIVPEMDVQISTQLMPMANDFDETDLRELCNCWTNTIIDLSNVCLLYENAIELKSKDMEKSCIEFAANHWKTIFSSQEFQDMNDSIAKKLMHSILQF